MCLHVTHDMLMCCYLFFWFWHYWLFPTVEDTNSVFFPTENLPTSKPHSTPLLCLQRCVTLLVRSIFSVYTNMVMKIFTAELSSIMISITFPSLHNFLSSLELLVFLCLFNLPCFLLTYHWFIPKIISNYLKFLSIVPTYQVFQQFFFFFFCISAIYPSGKHVSGGCCHLDWLLSRVVHSYDSRIYLPPICEILITSLANC